MTEPKAADRRFLVVCMVVAAIVSALPMILGVLLAPQGQQFLGYPYATDDHMVYAAWMRQAQEGRILFDNRFTIDSQPGLTIHLYFFVLGLFSKLTGIVWATTLAKAALSALFIHLLDRLLCKSSMDDWTRKAAVILAIFGSGLGFLVWHEFGEAIVKTAPGWLDSFLGGRLPIDTWQPEAFVVPSMLTNSLFMAALCLMLGVVIKILEAEDSWKAAGWGAFLMLLLMNIHSYDALLLGLVAVAFAVVMAVQRKLTGGWFFRCTAIFGGALPSAYWLWHVMQTDAVFKARAETLTYSPNFRQIVAGLGLLLLLGGGYLISRSKSPKRVVGAVIFVGMFSALVHFSTAHVDGYFLSPAAFAAVLSATIVAAALLADDDSTLTWIACWALVGLVAIYFPALFQRKLAMGLAIPWGILAAQGLGVATKKMASEPRRLAGALAMIVCGVSSVFWLQREIRFIRQNVSRTTVHAMYMPAELQEILAYFNKSEASRNVVLAMPGLPEPGTDEFGSTMPDKFGTPLWTDVNPILSGFCGVYTYAGHWSETPQYVDRRGELSRFFFTRTPNSYRRELIQRAKAEFLVGPMPHVFGAPGQSAFFDVSTLGEVVISGKEYQLVRIDPEKLASAP